MACVCLIHVRLSAELLLFKSFIYLPSFWKKMYLFSQLFMFLAVLGLRCCMGFSLIAVSRGYFLVAVFNLLIVVTSLVEHRL